MLYESIYFHKTKFDIVKYDKKLNGKIRIFASSIDSHFIQII